LANRKKSGENIINIVRVDAVSNKYIVFDQRRNSPLSLIKFQKPLGVNIFLFLKEVSFYKSLSPDQSVVNCHRHRQE